MSASSTANSASKKVPTIETERLLLRPIHEKDADDIFKFASNPRVAEFVIWKAHQNKNDTLKFIREWALPHYQQGVPDPLGITLHDEDHVFGTVGCIPVSGQSDRMEIGYALAEDQWGKGIATEACKAIMDFVFWKWPQVEWIEAHCLPANKRSLKVIEKLGMKKEKVNNERWIYAISKTQWKKFRDSDS